MKIIINADDFGLTSAVNTSILTLAQRGIVKSTTVMTNMASSTACVQLLDIDEFSIGLHINLTEGSPLSLAEEVPTLVGPEGRFLGKTGFLRAARKGSLSVSEVETEVAQQYSRLRDLVGDRIDHFDTHQGIGRCGVVYKALIQMGRQGSSTKGLRVYNKYLAFQDPSAQSAVRLKETTLGQIGTFGIRRVVVDEVLRWRKRRIRRSYNTPDGILYSPSFRTLDTLRLLESKEVGKGYDLTLEIPCHPASSTEGLVGTSLVESRVDEHRYLAACNPDRIRANGWKLRSYQL